MSAIKWDNDPADEIAQSQLQKNAAAVVHRLKPASERLQSLATANRLLTATTKTAPPRKSTRFAMIRVTNSPM